MAKIAGGVASAHFADVPMGFGLSTLVRRPLPAGAVPGLRSAALGLAAPLHTNLPRPRRVGLVAFWDDDASIGRFLGEHSVGRALAGGFHVRLRPLRALGEWPGLDADVTDARAVDHDGPVFVLTLGRLRMTRSLRFLYHGRRAQGAALDAPGLVWGTGLSRLPFVATCSWWESGEAAARYAYGRTDPRHSRAIDSDQARPFHKRSAFIRFDPYRAEGSLGGENALPAELVRRAGG